MKEIDNIVEDYILGKLSSEENIKFESEMANNPDLKSEVDLQTDIIEAIKSNRRLAMKQNLAQINPSVGVSHLVTQKILIGVATLTTALVVGIGIYSTSVKENQVIDASEKISKLETPSKNKPEENIITYNDKIEVAVEEKVEKSIPTSTPVAKNSKTKTDKAITVEPITKIDEDIPTTPYIPDGNFNATDDSDKHDINDQSLSPNSLPTGSEIKSLEEVEYVNCNGNDKVQSYKYWNGTYEFCGINESEPTIIQITSGNSKFIEGAKYLKYNHNYYEIVPTSSYEKLEDHIVTDKALRLELKKYKF